jgi:3-methyladenine DNA glycosylase AlkD
MNLSDVFVDLVHRADPEIAQDARRFFKTGPGEYGDGDQFRGIRVPVLRSLARTHQDLTLDQTATLLTSPFHEDRLLALLILVRKYTCSDTQQQVRIFSLFAAHTAYVNNWDLVDTSAPYISGPHFFTRNRKPLYRWAASSSLWERRIAIMSTFHFIRQGDFDDTLNLSARLLHDPEDLIHKAVGWMLREVGNKDRSTECLFLDQYAITMPRTMLRYAVEKFPASLKKHYMKKQK